jgi:SulP family sulfate permease
LFGVTVDSSDYHYQTVIQVVKAALHFTHWPTLMMGVFAFAVMLALKKISLRIPNVLVAVAATTLISWATGFEQRSTMPLESVVDADARALIVHFNAESTQLAQMGERRARINDTLKQAKIDGHRMIAINSRRDLDILNYQMELKAMQGCRLSAADPPSAF